MDLLSAVKSLFHKLPFICLFITFSVCASFVFSQISEGGIPPSFNYPATLRSSQATHVPVDFYLEDLRETDHWQARQGIPMPVAKLISVDYSIENSGYFTLLPGGENIWRLHLIAKDAVAIMLYYNDFYIPEGARLFIYKPDKSQLLGAYTHRTNPSGGLFATEFIGDDELILEYVASTTNNDKPRIVIGEIGYGYNTAALKEFSNITTRSSADCNVNINCEEGQAWQHEKKSVCYTFQRIGINSYICTASLMHNTAEDFNPLILTASHCGYNGTTFASAADMEQWLFYFNMELEDCSNNSKEKAYNTMTGCTLLANTGLAGRSDGMLLLLKNRIPDNYDVFYNGWDRSGDVASSGVCIHHPQGDNKKIASFTEPVKSYTFISEAFNGESQAHWNVSFSATVNGQGITEGGSSGSPLFNENKLVIGTLTGGTDPPVCYDPFMRNIYGKLSYHWDRYKRDSTTRMDVWLDPLNTGVTTFPGRFRYDLKPSPLNLNVVNLGSSVSLTWDAPQNSEKPTGYNVYRNNAKLIGTTSFSYIDVTPLTGSVTYSVSAVYANGEESRFIASTIQLIKYKAPTDLRAERNDNQIVLSWKAPYYEQTIFWGSLQSYHEVRFGLGISNPFYFGQLWSADEIQPLHNKTIKAVQFIPVDNNPYDVFISQGDLTYKQSIDNTTQNPNVMNTVHLTTPFVIDGSKSLMIYLYTAAPQTGSPARCDDGPAVVGKGNLFSVNAVEWHQLGEDQELGEFDCNFVITAIVSSESGNLSVLRKNNTAQNRKTFLPLDKSPVSLRNSVPTAFPEVTKYRVYRSGSYYKEVTASVLSTTDTYMMNNVYYHVSAFYDQFESEKSEIAYISTVDNDFIDSSIRIFPTRFTNHIMLQGYDSVSRIEVVSVSGKVLLVVNYPNQQINTSSLPLGLYFFRIYDINNKQHIIKAVKGL